MSDFDDSDDLRSLQRRATREAYETGLAMLANDATPATARASIVRAFLAVGAARKDDDGALEPHEMTPAQIEAALRDLTRDLGRRTAADAVLIEEKRKPSVFE